jgi:two-component system KDP operon response regulator KdpE
VSAPVALLVEDEPQIRRFVRAALEAEGWNVHETETVKQGLIDAGTRKPDLVILDLGLPDGSGVDFIRGLRGWSAIPVIVLSARVGESDKISALDAGADDYLTKPFGIGELLARIRVALRHAERVAGTEAAEFSVGDLRVDLGARRVEARGQEVHLTPNEYGLLAVLVKNAGRVVTQRQLLKEVWGPSSVDQSHYLRVYMAQLRHKLEAEPARPRWLITEPGVGYRLKTE